LFLTNLNHYFKLLVGLCLEELRSDLRKEEETATNRLTEEYNKTVRPVLDRITQLSGVYFEHNIYFRSFVVDSNFAENNGTHFDVELRRDQYLDLKPIKINLLNFSIPVFVWTRWVERYNHDQLLDDIVAQLKLCVKNYIAEWSKVNAEHIMDLYSRNEVAIEQTLNKFESFKV